jgi:hypothetical protein
MEPWLVVLIVAVVVAIAWFLWQRNTKSDTRGSDNTFSRPTASETGRAPVRRPASDRGLLQAAADTASGKEYETATGQLNEMTARLASARQESDRAAARLAGRADAALAAVDAAAAAYGGAVPGDGSRDCPPDYPVKGRMPTRHYQQPGQPSYDRIVPDVCFQSAEAAEAAGFSESGDEANSRGGGTVARESANLVHRDTVAVANEAGAFGSDEGGATVDIVGAASADDGSVPPGAIRSDGGRDCPPAYPIKAHESSRIYIEPEMSSYGTVVPHLCFSSVESAIAAGFDAAAQ